VPLSHVPNEVDHLKARRGIQATRRLIQEENLWRSNELAGDADTPLLATTETFLDRCTNDRLRLVLEPECSNQRTYASNSRRFGDGAVCAIRLSAMLGSEWHSLQRMQIDCQETEART
jgi:hypothetical protein